MDRQVGDLVEPVGPLRYVSSPCASRDSRIARLPVRPSAALGCGSPPSELGADEVGVVAGAVRADERGSPSPRRARRAPEARRPSRGSTSAPACAGSPARTARRPVARCRRRCCTRRRRSPASANRLPDPVVVPVQVDAEEPDLLERAPGEQLLDVLGGDEGLHRRQVVAPVELVAPNRAHVLGRAVDDQPAPVVLEQQQPCSRFRVVLGAELDERVRRREAAGEVLDDAVVAELREDAELDLAQRRRGSGAGGTSWCRAGSG